MSNINIRLTRVPRYLSASGVMLIPGRAESFMDFDGEDGAEKALILIHELVHHLQVLSSSYRYLEATADAQCATHLFSGRDPDFILRCGRELIRLRAARVKRAYGVSVLDLCEGAAVLCAYKYVFPLGEVDRFVAFRDHYFPGKANSPYRRTFDIMAEECGQETTFDLLSVITFLALQGDIPGRSFDWLVSTPKIKSGALTGLSLSEILDGLRWDPGLDARIQQLPSLHPAQRHMVFYPILIDIAKHHDVNHVLEIFARPDLLRKENDLKLVRRLLPPVVFGSYKIGERQIGSWFGLASEDADLRESVLMLSALVGGVDCFINSSRQEVPCPHEQCPSHTTGICAGWYAFMGDPAECGMRNRMKSWLGKEPFEIHQSQLPFLAPSMLKAGWPPKKTSELFPNAEELSGDEKATAAERYDEKHLLDDEDNDGCLMLTCKECRYMWLEWASRRKMMRGFLAICPKCQVLMRIDIDRVSTHWIDT